MVAKKKKPPRSTGKETGSQVSRDPMAGLVMLVLGSVVLCTAIAFDTLIHGTFDFSKLAFLYLGTGLLILGWMWSSLRAGEMRLAATPLDRPMLAVVAVLALSTALSVDWRCSLFGAYKTYEGAFELLAYVILFYAAARLRRSEVVVVLGLFLLAGVGAATYGVVQRVGADPLGWSQTLVGRTISTFGNPVFFGMYVVMVVPVAAGLALRHRRAGEGGRSNTALWIAAVAGAALLTARINPWLQTYRGADSFATSTKSIALLACALLLCLALGYRLVRRHGNTGWSDAQAWLALLIAVACNAALYCSRTVGALLGLVVGLAWFVLHMWLVERQSFTRYRRRWLALVVLLVLVNVGFNLWAPTSTTGRISSLIFRKASSIHSSSDQDAPARTLAPAGSFYKRFLLWRSALGIIREYPLLGVGPDAIERVIATHWSVDYQLRNNYLVEVEGFENRVHNELLEVAASQGLLGLGARLWLYGAFAWMVWRASRKPEAEERPVLIGLGASWLVLMATNVFEFPTMPISTAQWVLMGCTVAWIGNHQEPDQRPTRRLRLPFEANHMVTAIGVTITVVLLGWFWIVALHRPYLADRHFMSSQLLQKRKQLGPATVELEAAVANNPRLYVYRENLAAVLAATVTKLAADGSASARSERELTARGLIESSREGNRWTPWRGNGHAFEATGREMLFDALKASQPPADRNTLNALADEAAANLQTALEANPYNTMIRVAWGRHCLKHRKWPELRAVAEQTMDWWPTRAKNKGMPDLVLRAVAVMINDDDHQLAEEVLLQFRDRMPEAYRGKVYDGLARSYWIRKDWQEMIKAARVLLALDPPDAEGHKYLAIAFTQIGDLEEAEINTRQYLRIKPDDDYGRWLLATITKMKREGGGTVTP